MEARLREELVDAMTAERGLDPKVIHEEAPYLDLCR
jgi:hypothetical protein